MEMVMEAPARHVCNKLKRIVSDVLDILVIGIGFVILHIPAILVFVQAIVFTSDFQVVGMYLVSIFTGAACILFDLVYRVVIPYHFKGKTVGSSLTYTELVDENGQVPGLQAILRRAVASAFLTYFSFGLFLVAEIFCILFSRTHRSFVDVISGTYLADIKE